MYLLDPAIQTHFLWLLMIIAGKAYLSVQKQVSKGRRKWELAFLSLR